MLSMVWSLSLFNSGTIFFFAIHRSDLRLNYNTSDPTCARRPLPLNPNCSNNKLVSVDTLGRFFARRFAEFCRVRTPERDHVTVVQGHIKHARGLFFASPLKQRAVCALVVIQPPLVCSSSSGACNSASLYTILSLRFLSLCA